MVTDFCFGTSSMLFSGAHISKTYRRSKITNFEYETVAITNAIDCLCKSRFVKVAWLRKTERYFYISVKFTVLRESFIFLFMSLLFQTYYTVDVEYFCSNVMFFFFVSLKAKCVSVEG